MLPDNEAKSILGILNALVIALANRRWWNASGGLVWAVILLNSPAARRCHVPSCVGLNREWHLVLA